MDFKVGGTHKGITAIQMDIKIDGLTYDIIADALKSAARARNYIIDEIILKALPAPREQLSPYAPKMVSFMIDTDKIRDVIGKGGKVIQDICAKCNCKIDVEEDGRVSITAVSREDLNRAASIVKMIVEDPEVGAIYKGKVTRLMNFGAFVETRPPARRALCTSPSWTPSGIERVEDVVAVGDELLVKVTEIDQQGRINLSRKDALADMAKRQAQKAAQENQ